MRDLFQVINQIIEVIPSDESEFHQDLESCQTDAAFSPPEMMVLRWRETSRILVNHIPPEIEKMNDWQKKVICIWQGVDSIEEVQDAV